MEKPSFGPNSLPQNRHLPARPTLPPLSSQGDFSSSPQGGHSTSHYAAMTAADYQYTAE